MLTWWYLQMDVVFMFITVGGTMVVTMNSSLWMRPAFVKEAKFYLADTHIVDSALTLQWLIHPSPHPTAPPLATGRWSHQFL